MRVLIIGGAGFIGSSLACSLAERGDVVCTLDRFTHSQVEQNYLVNKGIDVIAGNACILSIVRRVMSRVLPDAVFILANDTYDTGVYSPYTESSILAQIVSNVAHCLTVHTPQYIFLGSSSEVYGKTRYKAIPESASLKPISTTGISFTWAEEYIRAMNIRAKSKFVFTSLRYFHIYGDRKQLHPKYDVVSFLVDHAIRENPVAIGGSALKVDCLHIDDAVSATLSIFDSARAGVVFDAVNVASSKGITQKRLFSTICDMCGVNSSIAFYTKKSVQLSNLVGGIDLLSSIGWKQTVRLEDGIARLIEERRGRLTQHV